MLTMFSAASGSTGHTVDAERDHGSVVARWRKRVAGDTANPFRGIASANTGKLGYTLIIA
jgi:hypothetical protein